jgi:CheY-like chemotaxis protein
MESSPYDLVLADGVLPDGSGIDLADKAKERGTEAIVITGYALPLPKEDLARHDFVWKPLRPRELLDEVSRKIGAPA